MERANLDGEGIVNGYPDVIAFLNLIGASEVEALSALLSAFGPPQPGVVAANWMRSAAFGNSAPTTKELGKLFIAAKFACTKCGSRLRITVDHIDGNAKNHALENLEVLCFKCNREKVGKGSSVERANVSLYRAAMELLREDGSFPTNKAVARRAGVQVGGAMYLLKLLRLLTRKPDDAGPDALEDSEVEGDGVDSEPSADDDEPSDAMVDSPDVDDTSTSPTGQDSNGQ